MRCFLAVPLEEPALGPAAELIDRARQQPSGVRWSRPEGLHLTLHFFGSIEDSRAGAMLELVRPAAAEHGPFGIHLDHRGHFPERGAARVLWLAPGEGGGRLAALAARCHELLGRGGVPLERRPYVPHCTVGRIPGRGAAAGAVAWPTEAVAIPPFQVRRMLLYESVAAPGGAVYTPRGELELKGPEAG